MKIVKKSAITILLGVVLLIILILPKDIFLNVKSNVLDNSMKEALYSFSVAKGLNGVISVVQNSYMDLTPAGVGVEFAAGEILDPLNDLVERFSLVMLYSITVIGVLKILNYADLYISVKLLLPIAIILFMLGIWFKDFFIKYAIKITFLSLALSLVVPFYVTLNNVFYENFLKDKYETSIAKLKKTTEEIKSVNIEKVEKKRDLLSYITNTVTKFDLQKRVDALKSKLKDIGDYIVNILIIFIFQSVVLPIFTLWLFFNVGREIMK